MPDINTNLAKDIQALRAPDGYLNAGIPNYDHLFGRDACVSALQLLDFDETIARSTLAVLARHQAKRQGRMNEAFPGKILHEHFPDGIKQLLAPSHGHYDILRKLYLLLFWRFPYYGSVDSGAWFIILMHRYYKKTNDETFLRELWPHALDVISWLEKRAANRPSELVAYKRTYIFGLRNQSWKDTIGSSLEPPTAMVEVQGYYYEAYNCLAELSKEVFENEHEYERFIQKAKKLKRSLNEQLWHEDTNYFALAINDNNERDMAVTSNPGHLLFTGILSSEQTKLVVKRLAQKDMQTPYGIRTLASGEPRFNTGSYQQGSVWPFDNWVIYQGLLKNGYTKEATTIKNGLLAAYKQLDEIPELYSVSTQGVLSRYPNACTIQAWSAGALINMNTQENAVL